MNICWKKAFDEIKQVVTHDTLLMYPDINKQFDINMNASEFHIGVDIIQTGGG